MTGSPTQRCGQRGAAHLRVINNTLTSKAPRLKPTLINKTSMLAMRLSRKKVAEIKSVIRRRFWTGPICKEHKFASYLNSKYFGPAAFPSSLVVLQLSLQYVILMPHSHTVLCSYFHIVYGVSPQCSTQGHASHYRWLRTSGICIWSSTEKITGLTLHGNK